MFKKEIKTVKFLCLAALLTTSTLAACSSDDDVVGVNTAEVAAADDFTDVRDGHVYRCLRVGDQIWMGENLAYFLPGGAADGCVTWEELQDLTAEDVSVDTTNVVVVISDEQYAEIYGRAVSNPDHDWLSEIGLTNTQLNSFLIHYYPVYGQAEFTDLMQWYKAFYDVLIVELEAAREAQRVAYIEALKREKAQVPITHRDEAEAANGGYIAEHGYLYTLEAAREAVPSEGGWRLPTDEDWKKLEMTLGMPAAECNQMNAWRGEGFGDALKQGGASGFDAVFSGCNAYQRTNAELFINKDEGAYFWASDESSETKEEDSDDAETGKVTVTYRTGIIRQLAIYSTKIWRGTTRLDNSYRGVAYSVRLVRDK